ncbi:MAG: HAD-IIA family hydrolase [Thermoprotei archaeon]|nr:HAD-IIA family hydrolase [Thermoprotei archaeon]
MSKSRPSFKYKVILSDLDGVLWRGSKVLYENIEVLKTLANEMNIKIYFTTNNSTKSREEYVSKLKSLGFTVTTDYVITSGSLTAKILREKYGEISVYVIGEKGLYEELAMRNLGIARRRKPEAVVVGLDRKLTYKKLAKALDYILNGSLFVATNTDATLPTNGKVIPGAGSIVAALIEASGKKPDMIVGKPEPWMYLEVLKRESISKDKVLVIGDRLDTDILGANRLGIDSLLVLTGVTSKTDLAKSSTKPKYVCNNLKCLLNNPRIL